MLRPEFLKDSAVALGAVAVSKLDAVAEAPVAPGKTPVYFTRTLSSA
jgi:hypothetical protein